jgi:prepilin-type N-terminal cleavage/methylation domain-containing protein
MPGWNAVSAALSIQSRSIAKTLKFSGIWAINPAQGFFLGIGMSMHSSRKLRGFTLIELVVVITLLGILAAFAVPRFIAVSDTAERASIESFIGSIRSARMLAFADFKTRGVMPSGYIGPQSFTLYNLTRCDANEPSAYDPAVAGGHYVGLSSLRSAVFQDPDQMACSSNQIQFITKSGRTVTINGGSSVTWNASPVY